MKKETGEWSVRMLIDFKDRITIDTEYQRGLVWSKAQKALLIDSILRGFDIPKIYLSKFPDGSEHLFNVVDGKQRLTAIWDFVSDKFPLLKNLDEIPALGKISGARWSDLSDIARDRLQFATITVTKIEDQTEEEVHELFLRLQKGEPLNSAERRHAMLGPVRDFVADKLAKAAVWEHTGLRSRRFGFDEHAAILLLLVLKNGPTGIKGADLHQMYSQTDFDPSGEDANHAIELLDLLGKVTACQPGTLRTRWGLVDLSICLMNIVKTNRKVKPEKIMDFFADFEDDRRKISATLAEMQTKFIESSAAGGLPEDEVKAAQIPEDMLIYHIAFSREGASKENVEKRSKIMYERLTRFLDQ